MNTEKEAILAQLACDLYRELESAYKVAARLGISHKTVYRLLNQSGVEVPGKNAPEVYARRKALRGDVAESAAQDYADGMKMKDLCEKYGVGQYAIRTAVRDSDISGRGRGGRLKKVADKDAAKIVKMYTEAGMSQMQVAAKFGCSQSVISRILSEQGVKIDARHSGANHGNWNGGKTVTGDGYVRVLVGRDDQMASMGNRSGYVLEHRLVMARYLGRPLTGTESVHHINGDRQDNQIENLQLRQGRHGKGVVYRCADCGSFHVVPVKIDRPPMEHIKPEG